MKKLFITAAFVFTTQFAMAQSTPAFKADVVKMLKMNSGSSQVMMAKGQIMKMLPQEKHAAFLVEFESTLPAYYDKMAEVYMKEYTHDDVKEILKFYESPIGKKMAQKSEALNEKSSAAMQEWGAGLQAMVMKYMQ